MAELKNPKHELFCREYIVDYNGTQAAIRALVCDGAGDGAALQAALVRAGQNARKLGILTGGQGDIFQAEPEDLTLVAAEKAQIALLALCQGKIGDLPAVAVRAYGDHMIMSASDVVMPVDSIGLIGKAQPFHDIRNQFPDPVLTQILRT